MSLLSLSPLPASESLWSVLTLLAGAGAGTLVRVLSQRLIQDGHGGSRIWIIEVAVALLIGVVVGLAMPLGSDWANAGVRACLTTYCATSAYLCMVEHRGESGHGFLAAAGHFASCMAASIVGILVVVLAEPGLG